MVNGDDECGRVYGLVDPRTNELRYVGSTTNLVKTRLSNHLSKARLKKAFAPVDIWFKELDELGLRPEAFVIEKCALEELYQAEDFYIEYYRAIGANLLNGKTSTETFGPNKGGRPEGQFRFRALQLLWAISVWPAGFRPTNELLAKSLGIGPTQVKAYLKYLRDNGYIKTHTDRWRLYHEAPWVNQRTIEILVPRSTFQDFAITDFVAMQ